MGPITLVDTLVVDGLIDAFGGYHMGITAENIARQFGIDRVEQNGFALASQQKPATAQQAGRFVAELASVTVKGRKATW